jgi:hypothetical protein
MTRKLSSIRASGNGKQEVRILSDNCTYCVDIATCWFPMWINDNMDVFVKQNISPNCLRFVCGRYSTIEQIFRWSVKCPQTFFFNRENIFYAVEYIVMSTWNWTRNSLSLWKHPTAVYKARSILSTVNNTQQRLTTNANLRASKYCWPILFEEGSRNLFQKEQLNNIVSRVYSTCLHWAGQIYFSCRSSSSCWPSLVDFLSFAQILEDIFWRFLRDNHVVNIYNYNLVLLEWTHGRVSYN